MHDDKSTFLSCKGVLNDRDGLENYDGLSIIVSCHKCKWQSDLQTKIENRKWVIINIIDKVTFKPKLKLWVSNHKHNWQVNFKL